LYVFAGFIEIYLQTVESGNKMVQAQVPIARVVRHPCLGGIEIQEVRDRVIDASIVTMDLKVAMIVRGHTRFRYRGSSSVVPLGATLAVEPGEVHHPGPVDGPFDADLILVDINAISVWMRDEHYPWRWGFSFKTPVSHHLKLARRFRLLTRALRAPASTNLLLEERAHSLLESLQVVYGGVTLAKEWRKHDGLNLAREFIHDTYTESISLDALADASGLPRARFLRAFRREFGMAPHAYQTRLRVDHARRLIASGATISDASVSAGFFDQSHLHRHFVKVFGLTPGTYSMPR
jgi:AraC-like DNA-binding protein